MLSTNGSDYQAVNDTSDIDNNTNSADNSDEDQTFSTSSSDLLENLSIAVNPLEESDVFGVDLYATALEFVYS